MSTLKVYLFGSPQIIRGDAVINITSQKAQALFYYLISNRQAHSREKLANLFWGETSERQAKASLRNTLYELRRSLQAEPSGERLQAEPLQLSPRPEGSPRRARPEGSAKSSGERPFGAEPLRAKLKPDDDYILAEGNTLRFNTESDYWLDTEEFERLIDEGPGDSQAMMEGYRKAVELYRGDFLEGFILKDNYEFEDWSFFERERLRRRYLGILAELCNHHGKRGEYDQAMFYANRILGCDNLQENVHRQLMRFYYASGDRSAALRQYEVCKELLERELGVPPLAETTALYEQILRQELVMPRVEEKKAEVVEKRPRPFPLRPWPEPEYLSAALVGRDEELAQLMGYLGAACQGNGRLAIIDGEVGIGKTRLVEELIDSAGPEAQFLIGRCYESEAMLPYQPLVEAIRGYLPALDLDALQISKVWLGEMSKLIPELGEMLPGLPTSIPLDVDQERSRLFEGVTQFMIALSRRQPLVLFIDDLHWADRPTLQLLQYLTRNIAQERVLLIGACRSEEVDEPLTNMMRSLDREGLLSRITLRRLTPEEVTLLIRGMARMAKGGERFSQRIYQETEGNPFFIIEVIRSLFEEGVLHWDEHGWSTDLKDFITSYAQIPVPASVRNVIQTRLDRLDEISRQVLGVAAVFRFPFHFSTVRRASGRGEDEVLDAFDRMLRAHLIKEVGMDVGGSIYDFNHDKIKEVAYQSMSGARQQWLHRRVGEALEREYADRLEEVVGRLADHFWEGGDREKALIYSIKAGEKARKLYANEEAITYYQRALELARDEGGLSTIYEGLGDVYSLLGRYDDAVGSYHSALDIGGQQLDRGQAAEINRKIGRVCERSGEYELALRYLEAGRRILEAEGPSLEMARLDNSIAFVYIRQGRYDKAVELCQRSLEMIEKSSEGEVDKHKERARIYNSLGSICLHQGDYAQAIDYFRQSLALRVKGGDVLGVTTLYNNLGVAHYYLGDYDQALDCYRKSFEVKKEIGDIHGLAISCANLGLILYHKGDYPQALHHLEEAVRLCSDIECEWLLPEPYRIMAEVHLALGDGAKALEYGKASLEMAKETGNRVFEGAAHRVLGKIMALKQGQWGEGKKHLARSIEIFGELHDEHELGESYYEYGLLLKEEGDVDKAKDCLSQAMAIFERTGAAGRLKEAESVYRQL